MATRTIAIELPQERAIPRRPGFSSIDGILHELLAPVATPIEQSTFRSERVAPVVATVDHRPIDRLEQLEREILALLGAAAPKTWSSTGRSFTRIMRAARRELRSGDCS